MTFENVRTNTNFHHNNVILQKHKYLNYRSFFSLLEIKKLAYN